MQGASCQDLTRPFLSLSLSLPVSVGLATSRNAPDLSSRQHLDSPHPFLLLVDPWLWRGKPRPRSLVLAATTPDQEQRGMRTHPHLCMCTYTATRSSLPTTTAGRPACWQCGATGQESAARGRRALVPQGRHRHCPVTEQQVQSMFHPKNFPSHSLTTEALLLPPPPNTPCSVWISRRLDQVLDPSSREGILDEFWAHPTSHHLEAVLQWRHRLTQWPARLEVCVHASFPSSPTPPENPMPMEETPLSLVVVATPIHCNSHSRSPSCPSVTLPCRRWAISGFKTPLPAPAPPSPPHPLP